MDRVVLVTAVIILLLLIFANGIIKEVIYDYSVFGLVDRYGKRCW